MSRILIGWPLASDNATLSGGSWVAGLPLANLQSPRLGIVARSTNDDNASTVVNVDFGAAQAVSVAAVVAHNMRSAAQWRIRGSAASDMSSAVYDSGWIDVWPEQWPANLLPSGHPNAATRVLTDGQIDALRPKRDAVHALPSEVTARYWRVELDDDANADGYVEIGRLVLAPRFQPSINYAVGAEFGFLDNTNVGRSLSGARYYDVRARARTLAVQFQNLPTNEAVAVLRDLHEEIGQSGQVYVVSDPADTWNLQRRSFLANVRQLSAVAYSAAFYSTVPVVFDEVI